MERIKRILKRIINFARTIVDLPFQAISYLMTPVITYFAGGEKPSVKDCIKFVIGVALMVGVLYCVQKAVDKIIKIVARLLAPFMGDLLAQLVASILVMLGWMGVAEFAWKNPREEYAA